MTGIAPDAEILALRGCWETAPGAPGALQQLHAWRARSILPSTGEVDVLNLSLGGPHDPLLAELVAAALDRDISVVSAAGRGKAKIFPASVEGVTVVSAVREQPGKLPGPPLIAPGTDVLSTAPKGTFDFFSGSSIAAAHVSGVAALLLDLDPALTPEQVRTALGKSSDGTIDACVAPAPGQALARCDPMRDRVSCRTFRADQEHQQGRS